MPQGSEDYDGACGVIVSPGEDARGRWMVEATRKGVTSLGAEFLGLEVASFFFGREGRRLLNTSFGVGVDR